VEQKRRALIWAATHARADAAERPSASGGSMQRSGWITWAQQEAKLVIF